VGDLWLWTVFSLFSYSIHFSGGVSLWSGGGGVSDMGCLGRIVGMSGISPGAGGGVVFWGPWWLFMGCCIRPSGGGGGRFPVWYRVPPVAGLVLCRGGGVLGTVLLGFRPWFVWVLAGGGRGGFFFFSLILRIRVHFLF